MQQPCTQIVHYTGTEFCDYKVYATVLKYHISNMQNRGMQYMKLRSVACKQANRQTFVYTGNTKKLWALPQYTLHVPMFCFLGEEGDSRTCFFLCLPVGLNLCVVSVHIVSDIAGHSIKNAALFMGSIHRQSWEMPWQACRGTKKRAWRHARFWCLDSAMEGRDPQSLWQVTWSAWQTRKVCAFVWYMHALSAVYGVEKNTFEYAHNLQIY